MNNDLSSTERRAEVTTDQTVDTILVLGTTGEMRLQIEVGVILSIANGLTVEAGGIVGGDGTIEGDVTIGSGGILSPGLMDVDAADLNIFAPALLGTAPLSRSSSANLSLGVENVPEPGTLVLLTNALIGLALLDWRHGRRVWGEKRALLAATGKLSSQHDIRLYGSWRPLLGDDMIWSG